MRFFHTHTFAVKSENSCTPPEVGDRRFGYSPELINPLKPSACCLKILILLLPSLLLPQNLHEKITGKISFHTLEYPDYLSRGVQYRFNCSPKLSESLPAILADVRAESISVLARWIFSFPVNEASADLAVPRACAASAIA